MRTILSARGSVADSPMDMRRPSRTPHAACRRRWRRSRAVAHVVPIPTFPRERGKGKNVPPRLTHRQSRTGTRQNVMLHVSMRPVSAVAASRTRRFHVPFSASLDRFTLNVWLTLSALPPERFSRL